MVLFAAVAVSAAQGAGLPQAAQDTATATLLRQLTSEYSDAFRSHDEIAAGRARGMAAAVVPLTEQERGKRARSAELAARQLRRTLQATSFQLQIWPLPDQIKKLTSTIEQDLTGDHRAVRVGGTAAAVAQVNGLLAAARTDAASRRVGLAGAELAEAYAVFAQAVAAPLDAIAPELVSQTETDLWAGINAARHPGRAAPADRTLKTVGHDLHDDAAALGDVKVSRATIVTDAAIILFREGLEAVLILAAITASFVGARRRLRRPVLLGALLGLLATAVTYVLAQTLIDALGDGGLRLQAITGLLAIGVLLVVTNWFFHRMYWSDWIGRFNRRRKALERVGFVSGQTLGFVILGLTSVYREGFETVLFLQNLQVSAGTGATLLGVAIGLAATLAVGIVTFAVERKLPYKKMLIATGVLIGLVLAIMTGVTVHNLQGLGWLPTSNAGFLVDPRLSQWIGLYPTWEGMAAQIGALLVVYGSYAVARQLQRRKHRRAIAATSPTLFAE